MEYNWKCYIQRGEMISCFKCYWCIINYYGPQSITLLVEVLLNTNWNVDIDVLIARDIEHYDITTRYGINWYNICLPLVAVARTVTWRGFRYKSLIRLYFYENRVKGQGSARQKHFFETANCWNEESAVIRGKVDKNDLGSIPASICIWHKWLLVLWGWSKKLIQEQHYWRH